MKKIILSAIVFVGAMTLNAQDEAPKLSISGTVDAYYQTIYSTDDVSGSLELRLQTRLDLL